MFCDGNCAEIFVLDSLSGFIAFCDQVGVHTQASDGFGGSDVVERGLIVVQWFALPILADFGQQAMFHGIPF